MKGKWGKKDWLRGLRRGTALFLATVGVWLLTLTTDLPGAVQMVKALGESPAFVAAALSAELTTFREEGELGRWGELVVKQSPWLKAGVEPTAEETLPPQVEETAVPTEPDDPQDTPLLPPMPSAESTVKGKTFTTQEGDVTMGELALRNTTGQAVDPAALAVAAVDITLPEEGPQILIMHTHGTEAYTMEGEDTYIPSDNARTTDCAFNVVRVGAEIARILTAQGFSVLHDTTLYDYPAYSGAYERSKAGVEGYLEQYPSIQMVLDVHRDALLGEDGEIYKTVATVAGEEQAQVMLVVGTDDAGLHHPDWRSNLTFALRLQRRLTAWDPSFVRPITLRTSRFNQHLTHGSLLLEVGSHGNTLQEALDAAQLFAHTLAQELEGLKA